jgi:hypothetical protein
MTRTEPANRAERIPEKVFVIDSVAHAYNLDPSNYRIEGYAEHVSDMVYDSFMKAAPEELTLSKEQYMRDWSVEEAASMLFVESQTDIAVFHPTPIKVFKDGLTSVEKAKEAVERWPDRFLTMATVDPLDGEEGLEEFERQIEELDPVGLKLYPSSWAADGSYDSWKMSDTDIVYPFFEKAEEHGIELIAVHKALPLGSVPMDAFHQEDVEVAATSFPDLNFAIVHGGMAFTEETAWQIARYDNIYVNLEVLVYTAHARPRYFEETFAELFEVAGDGGIDQLYWGTGCMAYPPQPQLEAFWEFQFTEDVRHDGLFDVPELTSEHKERILGKNYAEMLGLDIDELKRGIEGDEFDRTGKAPAEPYSTVIG